MTGVRPAFGARVAVDNVVVVVDNGVDRGGRIGAAEGAEASAQLRDISALGMRVRVDPVQEQLFASVEEMETRFRLPTKPDELALTTRIRHRHLDEQGLVYGMAFTRFRGQQDQIIAYVMSLQRARARRAR